MPPNRLFIQLINYNVRHQLLAGTLALLSLAAASFSQAISPSADGPATTRPILKDAHGNTLHVATRTGHITNFDESKVGTYILPNPLVLANGQAVRDADTWYNQRRPEILKLYENEIYGRVPTNTPKVTWEVASSEERAVNGAAVLKHLVGRMGDGADGPKMYVSLYIPTSATSPVPVILCLNFPPSAKRGRAPADGRINNITPSPATMSAQQRFGDPVTDILARGWAYATVIYTDIQADRPNSFTSGVIGLTLPPGQAEPAAGQWGTISAWAWGASRIADYLQTDKSIDPARIALMGHSRLGKTVLWASARDARFAVVFSSCAGELGSSLARRDFGETVDDMAQNFPYQFARNLQKYPGHWNDMPVDTHMMISLTAPRPLFISGGTLDLWSDPVGEYLAEVAAGPVYRLLGKKDLGMSSTTPPLDTPLITGDLGFNYHTGPHEASPSDWKAFLEFTGKYFSRAPSAQTKPR
ncbi:MAG: acetylxylan esterase [Planctomycetota bacterium]|nr:acetylxylan esterase [Planctomycetota bacterium]